MDATQPCTLTLQQCIGFISGADCRMTILDYSYSFAPAGKPPMALNTYLRTRSIDFPALRGRAVWELPKNRMPQAVTEENFWTVIPLNQEDLTQASSELCGKLIMFCLRVIEKVAAIHEDRFGSPPTPAEIVQDINAVAEACKEQPEHIIWKYAVAAKNLIVDAAATNAMNNRWGAIRRAVAYPSPRKISERAASEPTRRAASPTSTR